MKPLTRSAIGTANGAYASDSGLLWHELTRAIDQAGARSPQSEWHREQINSTAHEIARSGARHDLKLVAFYRQVLCDDAKRDLILVNPLFLHVAVLGASDLFSSANPLMGELVPEGTYMERLATEFRDYLIKMVLDGLRKR